MNTIPEFKLFLKPVLEVIAEKGRVERPRVALLDDVANRLNLSPEARSERLESGDNRLSNRVGWALTYLTKAGLVQFPRRNQVHITERGRSFLQDLGNNEIEIWMLKKFPEFQEFAGKASIQNEQENPSISPIDLTPEELITQGYSKIIQDFKERYQEQLAELTPKQFEHFVLKFMRALGYGEKKGELKHTGNPNDRGIDGVISLDPLGLEKICIQAKRYQKDNGITASSIREFIGSMAAAGYKKGIFITTSYFTDEARATVQQSQMSIILIDGDTLTQLAITHGIGVYFRREIRLPELDQDWFDYELE
jgi:restriction system protein